MLPTIRETYRDDSGTISYGSEEEANALMNNSLYSIESDDVQR